ncbi:MULTISPECIES: Panacea domain-containing protein [Enterococcus]|uniref:Panacea domain-containing protein n=1 Tax=Enterococcus TaxID=1350 RepID=UPI0022E2D048|nr:type II toxin-antitoxin system antitoxin SocA domain-containing protein [Enterococcus thailandicus]
MTMRDLADHVIAHAQNTEVGITNLQLQKVLYFTLINSIRQGLINEEWLQEQYDSEFLVWRYGPVIEDIYEEYRIYGAANIFEQKQEAEEFSFLNPIIENLLHENVFNLVNESHRHDRWLNNRNQIIFGRSDVPYSVEDLIDAAG